MRAHIKIIFLTLLTVWLVHYNSWSQSSNQEQPNVLFIICDDLNDYQGIFSGHPQAITPNINKLAASGVQFINAQSNVPVCSPSRNSLITGVYPHASKDFGWTKLNKQPVLKNNKTIIQYFKENGYFTLGTGKIIHGNIINDWDEWGMNTKHNYGPLFFNGEAATVNPSVPNPYNSIGPIDGSYGRLSDGGISEGKEGQKGWIYGWDKKPLRYINDEDRDLLQDELHAQWAIKKLKELETQENQKPFFMGIGFVRPHTPLHAPDKYFDMFPIKDLKLEKWQTDDNNDTYWKNNFSSDLKGPKYYKMLLESYNGDREVAIKHFLQAYLACVAFVDEQVGKVMEGLNNSTFKDNTIVVFTSDHGWQMGEKEYLYKNSPWDESTRIPFMIRDPSRSNKLDKVAHAVSLIDIYPTLKELCHLEKKNTNDDKIIQLDGYSLQPFLNNPKTEQWQGPKGALTVLGAGINEPIEGLAFSNNLGALWYIEITKDLDTSYVAKQNYTYRTKDWRYILYKNGKEELYNHTNDSYEWNNLAQNPNYKDIKSLLNKEMLLLINSNY